MLDDVDLATPEHLRALVHASLEIFIEREVLLDQEFTAAGANSVNVALVLLHLGWQGITADQSRGERLVDADALLQCVVGACIAYALVPRGQIVIEVAFRANLEVFQA